MRNKITYFLLFIAFQCAYADWDPEWCLTNEDLGVSEEVDSFEEDPESVIEERRREALSAIERPHFRSLKESTVRYLKGSWCSEEKTRLMMDLICLTKPKLCVEIGVFSGSSMVPIAATLDYLEEGIVVGVDAWSNAIAVRNMDYDDPNRPWWGWVDMESAHQTFFTRLWEHALYNYWDEIKASSEEAAQYFDEIDFLHLDGDYTEKGSLQDVRLYLPKVKRGGFILLSNVFVMVKGKAPKMKAFAELFDACEMICEVDRDNVVLFRKN